MGVGDVLGIKRRAIVEQHIVAQRHVERQIVHPLVAGGDGGIDLLRLGVELEERGVGELRKDDVFALGGVVVVEVQDFLGHGHAKRVVPGSGRCGTGDGGECKGTRGAETAPACDMHKSPPLWCRKGTSDACVL